MDYQTFNGQQQPQFGGIPSAHSPQTTLPPQAQFPQAGPSFGYGGPPPQFASSGQAFAGMGGHGPGGVDMMPQPMQPGAGGMQRAAMQQAYSTAPYSQALPSPAHQQFAQNRQTASPAATSGSPYATPHMQQHPPPPPLHQQSPGALPPSGHQQQPMGQTKAEPAQAQTPVKPVPPSPVSPAAHARNQDRVATLLEINSLLIKEVCDLQSQGKAGQVGPAPDAKPEADKPQPSKEYLDCMRRLQANLAYLAQNAESNKKPSQALQPGPAIMSVPAAPAELAKLYQKLVGLFPGWKGQTTQMKQSPGPQRMNSAASTASQPPNSAGLQPNWSQNAMANMQQAQLQAKIEQ
ncbi:hypothetical protein BDU57DRAFT_556484 [Ampelomyces quisqualis]|uniref:Uncharacterized protein n=1 Tax=Ampelomyces quisqualis TaxID=50730 RepID=A0A6A5QLE4_AMPQU|nr:hypothetical protein BDU57DRAFT_556484 [Ampelomyces quisqualis]